MTTPSRKAPPVDPHHKARADRYLASLANRTPPKTLLPGQMLGRDRFDTLYVLTRQPDGSYGGLLAMVDDAGCVVQATFTVPELVARQWARRHERHVARVM